MPERAGHNLGLLAGHELFATAPAGRLLHEQLEPPVRCFRSGPCGSDQQIGAPDRRGRDQPSRLLLRPAGTAAARP